MVFISQQPLEFGSYFRLCKILLYQSFAVLLKINCLQHKPAGFFSEKKKKVESTSLIVKPSYSCSPCVCKPVVVRVSLSARGCFTKYPSGSTGHLARKAQISTVVKDETHFLMPWEYGENEVSGCSFPFGGSPGDLHPSPPSPRAWLGKARAEGWVQSSPEDTWQCSCSLVLKPLNWGSSSVLLLLPGASAGSGRS